MNIDLSEILPLLVDQFGELDRVLITDEQSTFAWINPGNINPRMIGFLQSDLIPQKLPSFEDPEWADWRRDRVAQKASGGAGVFWMCPGIPELALVRLRLSREVGRGSVGRRFQGAVRSNGDFRLFSTEYLPGEVEEAITAFHLRAGDFEVFLDEHFLWPSCGFLEVRNDQILFTLTFVPTPEINAFPDPTLV
jgi:hypothetical protein